MKAKTIGQYVIMKWLNQEFAPGCLEIYFVGQNEALIKDRDGGHARVIFDKDSGTIRLE